MKAWMWFAVAGIVFGLILALVPTKGQADRNIIIGPCASHGALTVCHVDDEGAGAIVAYTLNGGVAIK